MRVLHVINGLATGGAETVLYRLATYPSEVEHEVICLEGRATYSGPLEAHGIRVHHLDWVSPATSVQGFARLHRLIKDSHADVVQAWMYRSNLIAGIAARMTGIPVVWNIRSSTLDSLRRATRVLARLGGTISSWLPAAVINCSSRSAEIHAHLGYDAANTTVIVNGYDPQEFRPDAKAREQARRDLGVERDCFLLGTIARWHPQKGYPILLRALEIVRDRGVRFRAILVGRDIDDANATLTGMVRSRGLVENVQLLGERADVAAIGRALDLHVLASIGSEGFPNVVAETMLCGTPNVATDVGESSVIVGEDGWIVPPGDAVQLADAIERAHSEWKNSPKTWRARCDAGRQRIADTFSLDRMVASYKKIWSEVSARRPKRVEGPAANAVRSAERPGLAPKAPVQKAAGAQKPARVLHIINNLGLGGAETLLYRLTTRGSPTEHVVVSMGSAAWYSEHLQKSGVPLHHLDIDSPPQALRGALRLNRIIRESDADIVQCWMYRSNVFGGLIAQAAGKPVVWGIHCSSLEPLRRSSRALARLSGVLARWNPDYIINCSTRSAELHDALGFSAARSVVVHNGYDDSAFFPDEDVRAKARDGLGIGPDVFTIGTIARWHRQKDIPNFLAALAIARKRGVSFRAFLLGVGLQADNSMLQTEVENSGCGDWITLLGPRSDVQNVARALDLHVLASCGGEAFPNVVAETMLSGTPNAVTEVGDMPLMVGKSGWVVPPSDPDQLADAIVQAYHEWKDSPAKWAKRRKAARKQISDNFSFERMSEGYERVWREVLATA